MPGPGRALAPLTGPLLVLVLFLMSFTLPFRRLRSAAADVRSLTLSAAACWILLPLMCWLAATVLFGDRPGIAAGFALLGALPSTLASAAVWTRNPGGDDAVPLVFTTVSMISVAARFLVLTIVLVAASRSSDTFRDTPLTVAAVFATVACIHILGLVLTWLAARWAALDRTRTVGVLFGGTQKSLYVGVWIAAAWYPDLDAALVPILAYHIAQLVIDTGVASRYAYAILKGNLGGMTPMMRLSLVVVVLMACIACAGSEENLRPGPYVGLAFVGAFSTFDNYNGVDEDLNDGVGAPGVQAMLGYQMWDRAAVELVYEGGMMFEGETDLEVDVNTFMLQGKLFFGVLPGEAFQLYGIGGFGYEWVKASGGDARFDDGGMAGRAGLGLQYYITKNLPVFLEYSHTIAIGEDVEDYSYGGVKLGIMYRF